jgi:hypothetical protein
VEIQIIKKGHAKFVERQLQEQLEIHGDDEDIDIPEILEVNNNMIYRCHIFLFTVHDL